MYFNLNLMVKVKLSQVSHPLRQTEVYNDPSSVQPPPVPYQTTPQVFLFSRPATAHLDRDAAASLAWKLRGRALTLLVHRFVF